MAADPGPAGFSAALQRDWAGPRPGWRARLLQPLSWLYAGLAALHRGLYRSGLKPARRAPVPVLVVGNLVAGGGGKTPTVLALLPRLRALGFTPGVVSRGHGRRGTGLCEVLEHSRASEVGDEPLLIHRRGRVPVVVGADRVAAAQALCAAHAEVDLIVTDDGLQHHRLAREAEVWVFDERGAGNGLLLPAGPLRQPLPRRVPAHARVLYTAGQASTPLPGCIGTRQLGALLPLADWWRGAQPGEAGVADGWAVLPARGRPVLAAAGLARPEAFFRMLEARGLSIRRLPLADHHSLQPPPWPADTTELVLTEKDAVKLPPEAVAGGPQVWVATLDFQPEAAFDAALASLVTPLRRRPPFPA